MKTALLDTNVLIALADTDRQLLERDARILRYSGEIEFYVHPLQLEDIERDKDEHRRVLLKSRIKQFKELEKPPKFDERYFEERGWSCHKFNDIIDNNLLACVFNPVVDLLITEDKGIIRKACSSGIGQKVMTLERFGSLIIPREEPQELASVSDDPCHTLDLKNHFFNSLRQDYDNQKFDEWFNEKCARGQRRCWNIRIGKSLCALCIYKEESSEIIDDQGFNPDCKMLKLCTFKVSPEYQGSKAGERLLYKAFQYATSHDIEFIYFTVKEGAQPHLEKLAEDFGFRKYGKEPRYKNRVFGKYTLPQSENDYSLDKAEYNHLFYPSYKSDGTVGKYIVPIKDEYHERLFPDVSDFRETLFGNDPSMYTSESNTIRKAYLCKANINRIEKGDLLLFYRSIDRHSVEVLGGVSDVARLSDNASIRRMVNKRTVYSVEEISDLLKSANHGLLVICFDILKYFSNSISLEELNGIGVSCPQSIISLSDEQFKKIMEGNK